MLLARQHTIISQNESCILAQSILGKSVILIFFPFKFTINNLKDILQIHPIQDYDEYIIVCKSIMVSNLKKIENISPKIEIFTENELSFNLTRHYLVPKMVRLEKKISDNWPIMLESDPMSKFLKFKHGDFIEITYKDASVSYRIVKKNS